MALVSYGLRIPGPVLVLAGPGGQGKDMEEESLVVTGPLLKGLGGSTSSQIWIPPPCVSFFLMARTCEVGLGERQASIYEGGEWSSTRFFQVSM